MLWSLLWSIPLRGPDLVLPEGFELPPWPQFVTIVILLTGVVALLWALKPKVTDWTALALAPWVALGGILHALHQVGDAVAEIPAAIDPFFGSPAVYGTVAIMAGIVWIASTIKAAMSGGSADVPLGVIGTGIAVTIAVLVTLQAFNPQELLWPGLIALSSMLVAGLVWIGVSLWFTDAAAYTRKTGALVVFGHVLDGISTWVGHDVLGYPERTPLSRGVLWVGEQIPLPEVIGAGWLFLLVKIVLVVAILVLFREWTREEPQQARIVLLFVAAVGLGPGVHNLILFAITEAPVV